MNKKRGAILTLILAIAVFGYKIYRKYEWQRNTDQKRKIQRELFLKNRKYQDSLRRIRQDSIGANKSTYLDSMTEVNKKKIKEMDKILEILDKKK